MKKTGIFLLIILLAQVLFAQPPVRGVTRVEFENSYNSPNVLSVSKKDSIWNFWRNSSWEKLEIMFKRDSINELWPPMYGFVEIDNSSLEVGDMIDRYGRTSGRFTAPHLTPYPARALPNPDSNTQKPFYHVYRVAKRIPVKRGRAIPWFYQDGLGVQYMLQDSVGHYLKDGALIQIK